MSFWIFGSLRFIRISKYAALRSGQLRISETAPGIRSSITANYPRAGESPVPDVGRLLKKLADFDYLSLLTFPGRSGTVIYLKNYLSTMFQISDVMIDKEEVAMCLNLRVSVPDTISPESGSISDEQICVSTELPSVSKPHMLYFVRKVLRTLEAQGISCLSCPKSKYMLYPLSDDCTVGIEKGTISAGLAICCGAGSPLYRFEMTIIPNAEAEGACDNVRKDV